MSRWLRSLLRAPLRLYQHGWGWVLGHRFLRLTHRGRRSGRVYQTVLEVLRFDPATREATAMSGFGPGADWLRNIEANGQLEVSIGRSTFPATYRLLEVEESVRVFAEYERRNIVVRPVIRAVLGRLVGWRFDGSDAARHKLADQLPIVAFRPLIPIPFN